jgi:hypothetical protein
MAGACWSARPHSIGPYFAPLRAGDVVIRKGFTLSAFTRRGVFTWTLRHMIATLATEGVPRIFVDARVWNTASLRGIVKAGFTELGRSASRCCQPYAVSARTRPTGFRRPS